MIPESKVYVKTLSHFRPVPMFMFVCVDVLVDGGWSRWSPWSRCDKRCGGGRSIRTRSCSSPPPKNGGKKCEGEKNQVKPCNPKPCGETEPACSHTLLVKFRLPWKFSLDFMICSPQKTIHKYVPLSFEHFTIYKDVFLYLCVNIISTINKYRGIYTYETGFAHMWKHKIHVCG